MIDVFLKTGFILTIILIFLCVYFHYRVQYLMFFKIRPLLKQDGIKKSGVFPLKYKKDLILYEEIYFKNHFRPDLSVSVRSYEKRSWVLLIISSVFCIVFLILGEFWG